MTKEESIKIIREACIKANPDILRLEFGCEIVTNKWSYDGTHEIITGTDHGERIGFECVFRGKALIYAYEIQEILGRPIRLADVLVAIAGTYAALDAGEPWVVDAAGQIYDLREQEYLTFLQKSKTSWDLCADRLEDQSQECLKFISELLA